MDVDLFAVSSVEADRAVDVLVSDQALVAPATFSAAEAPGFSGAVPAASSVPLPARE